MEAVDQIVFAHVSDPHFGAERLPDQPIRNLGQSGHDLRLCQELGHSLEHLRERTAWPEEAPLPLVMSGDLTRTGRNPEEFEVGRDYLEGTWPNPRALPTRRYGLGLGARQVVKVPGNHDHWDGDCRNQWGYNAAIKNAFFPATPFRKEFLSPQGRIVVEFFGVDSCSGFPPLGVGSNRRAKGILHDQELKRLNARLAASLAKEAEDHQKGVRRVRVLVCHHSFQGHWLISWFFGSLELRARDIQALTYLAGRYRVAAVLTGHAHDFLADRYATPYPPHALREFRSATTLQAPAGYFKQGFFGHRIVLDGDGKVWWSAYPYQWQGSYFYPLAVEESVPLSAEWNPFYFQVP